VVALLPTLTETDMAKDLEWFRWVLPTTPEQVAKALISGLQRGSAEILVGWQSHLAVWGDRLFPWLLEKVLVMAAPLQPNRQQRERQLRQAGAISR